MKKIIGVLCAVIFICAGFCGCGSTDSTSTTDKKADKEVEAMMQAGPTTMDEWKVVMLNYESYFKDGTYISQSNDSDSCYITMANVTEDEFRAFVDEVIKTYSKDTFSDFSTDVDGKPLCGFYGDTPDGKYKLSASLYYNEYIYEDSLICDISCRIQDADDDETDETEE
jgi:hypothetical protein